MSEKKNLSVIIDGAPLPDDEARALWTKFSEYMDVNRGDMAGFAKGNGYVSVAPEVRRGEPVLVIKTAAAKPSSNPAGKPASKPASKPRPPPPRRR